MHFITEQFFINLEKITVVVPSNKMGIVKSKIQKLVESSIGFNQFETFIVTNGGFFREK